MNVQIFLILSISLSGAVAYLFKTTRVFSTRLEKVEHRLIAGFLSGIALASCLPELVKTQVADSNHTFYRAMVILGMVAIAYFVVDRWFRDWKAGFRKLVDSQRASFWIGLSVTVLAAVALAVILSFRTFPISEGWYSVYAKYINDGKIPYKDFELLFMPLYSYLIALITRVFGYDLYVLRIFGVLVFAGIAAVAYTILSRLFHPWVSVIAAITALYYLQSEVVQVFYDYIRVFDLLTYAATLLLMIHIGSRASRESEKGGYRIPWPLVASGALASFAFLVRQSSGALVLAYGGLLLVFLVFLERGRQGRRRALLDTAGYVAAAVLPVALLLGYMALNGSLGYFYSETVGSAIGAKGGIATVLFAWIPRWFVSLQSQSLYLVAFVLGIGINYTLYKTHGASAESGRRNFAASAVFLVAVFGGLAFCYINKGTTLAFAKLSFTSIMNQLFVIPILVFLFLGYRAISDAGKPSPSPKRLEMLALSGMIIAIGYGSGTSAGLSQGQTALALALLLGLLLEFSRHRFGTPTRVVVLVLSVTLCLGIVSSKYTDPYSWWGLQEGDIRAADQVLDVPHMKNITVSASTKTGIEKVVSLIEAHSKPGDRIFSFPQIPVFYLLSDRYPATYTLVQWFDVSNDQNVVKDIDVLKNDLPKVIVHLRVDEFVISSHETLFRNGTIASGLRRMSEALDKIEKQSYVKATSLVIQNCKVDVYYLKGQ